MEATPTLAQLLEVRGALTAGEVVQVGFALARALEKDANGGTIRGNLQLENLVVDERGEVEITEGEPSPDCIAPEQVAGDEALPQSDLYSLGCVLFCLASGHPPFRQRDEEVDAGALRRRRLEQSVPSLARRSPGADPALSNLISRLMAQDPAERPMHAELVETMRVMSTKLRVSSPRVVEAGSKGGRTAYLAAEPMARTGQEVAAQKPPQSWGNLVLVLLLAGLVLWLFSAL